MIDFKQKVALVTGGASGIGRAACLAFAQAGARVISADVDLAGAEATAAMIRMDGGECQAVRTDVARDDETAALIDKVVSNFGRIDCAFNNAGVEGELAATADCSLENWHRIIAINLTGVFHCMRHEIRQMLRQGGGSIVNCASIAGLVGFPSLPAYVASKHGIVGLTRAAALEYATQNVRVNAVCPGTILTPMLERVAGGKAQAEAAFGPQEPVGRLGRPEEIADAVLWLCSSGASFVTGHALAVDGGWVAR